MTKKNKGWVEPPNKINRKGKIVAGRHSEVRQHNNSHTLAEPIELQTWDEVAKRELEEELHVKTKRRSYSYYENLGAIALESIRREANNGEREWIVFPDYDTAKEAALNKVREDLENEPGIFVQSWLRNFIKISDTDRRIIASEEANNFVDEVFSEEDIIKEADIKSEIEEINERIAETEEIAEIGDIDKLLELEDKKEKLIDKAKEKVREDKYDEIYKSLEDPIKYFVDEQGIYSIEDLLKQSFIRIDVEKAAQDAVDTDGAGHFLDGFDSIGVELSSGAIAYGTN